MKNSTLRFRIFAGITLFSFFGNIVGPFIPETYALNTTYYVDATDGNDANDGLSPATAWRSLTHVNSQVFSEGDNLLFQCGEIWEEELILNDSGVDGNPFTIGQYGTCDSTNYPVMYGTGGYMISDIGGPNYVEITGIHFSGSTLSVIDDVGTDIIFRDSQFTSDGSNCFAQENVNTVIFSGNIIDSCQMIVGSGATATTTHYINNTISTSYEIIPIISESYDVLSDLIVRENTFSGLVSGAIKFSANSTILRNYFYNTCTSGNDCSTIANQTSDVGVSTISQNTIIQVGTGILLDASADAIRIGENQSTLSITGNTISNAERSISLSGASNITISQNTFFHPRTLALEIVETTSDSTHDNTVSNNTFVTYNPNYPMISLRDSADASGSLAVFSSNRYVNVYKPKLPIIQQFKLGGDALSLNKSELTTLDPSAINFTYFGYKVYTNTGSYSGANLITNGNFSTNITGWSGDSATLEYDSTGSTLHVTQDMTQTGFISSNSFSLDDTGVYEVSGIFRNLTGTGARHIELFIRQDADPFSLYAERVIDVVATSSGTAFTGYITANSSVSDARLDIMISNPGNQYEIDNVTVRRVTGLTYNARTNEVRLMVNSGATDGSFSCPGGGGCSLQYRDTSDNAVTFPTSINAYSSKIILWRDPNSDFTPTNILHKPSGSLVPSAGSVPNNTTVDLTWTSENANIITLDGSTNTGAFSFSLADSGAVTVLPPNDGTTTFTLHLENDIGQTSYPADVVTSNTPPITTNVYYSGYEESLSITGYALATDINSGGSISYSLFDPPAISQGTINSFDGDGLFDFTPALNFCGDATFTFRAFDAFGMGSDAISPGVVTVNVICTNDPPVAVDDTLSATGGISNYLDVLTNETDIDSIYEPQTYYLTGFTNPSHGTLTITGNVFEYVPDAMYVGPDSFLYSMMDQSGGLSNTGTVTLNVYPGSNLPPLVSGDAYVMTEDTDLIQTLSGYDLNPGDVLTYTVITLPTQGVVTLSGAEFTYIPNTDYNGTDTFEFAADDTALTSSSAIISITVNGTPDIPVVQDDTIGVEMSAVVTLNVMANDSDADHPYDPQTLSISGYSLPSHGTLSVVGTGFQYVSDTPYIGSDSFEYSISDQDGNLSNTGTVTLNITSTNTPPIAYSGSFTPSEDIAFVGMLSGYDVDGTPLTFQLISDVSDGTLSLGSTGGFVYTSNLNYYGPDSFSFQVTDGVFTSGIETVDLTILSLNDAPVAGHDTATGTEDMALTISTLLANDTDVDAGDTLTLANILTQGSSGTAVISGISDVVYTPDTNFCGMDTFTYQIQDQSGALSGTGNVTVNINCTNDAPSIVDSSYSMTGNVITNSGYILTGGLAGSDVDLDPLEYTLDTTTSNGVLVFSTGGSFQYTPNLSFSGSDSFTYSATDGVITTSTATVIITVNPNNYNTLPLAYSGNFVTNEDVILVGTLSGFDLEGSSLIYSLGSGVTNGTLSLGSTGGFVYTPNANYYGEVTFTFRVYDGMLYSSYETGTITITSVNDLPIASSDTYSVAEDTPTTLYVLANDSDTDGTVTSVTNVVGPSTGGTAVVSGTGILFTPSAGYCHTSPITLTYQALDGSGGTSSIATGSITLTCVNDAPLAQDDSATGSEDTTLFIPVLANDSDPDVGDSLVISQIGQSSTGGTAVVSGTGILFTPTANYCNVLPITLTYRLQDSGALYSNTGNVSISITCINDAPSASAQSYLMTGYTLTGTVVSLTGILVGTDIEGGAITYSGITMTTSGTLSLGSTGGFVYTPIAGLVGSDSFTYQVSDGSATSAIVTVNICVISPDTNIARPSCAPAVSGGGGGGGSLDGVSGNGGGGGGGGGSATSSQIVGGSTSTVDMSIYRTVTSSDGVSPRLLRQLFLGRNELTQSSDDETGNLDEELGEEDVLLDANYEYSEERADEVLSEGTFSTLLEGIKSVVDFSRDIGMSDFTHVEEIRNNGRKLLIEINDDDILTASEKADALRKAAEDLREYLNPEPQEKEYKALQYVVRILSARHNFMTRMVSTMSTVFEFNDEPIEEDEDLSDIFDEIIDDTSEEESLTDM